MKNFLMIIMLIVSSLAVNAQEQNDTVYNAETPRNFKAIWAHSKKALSIGWVSQDFGSETSSVSHSKFGVMFRNERTIPIPSKPIGGVLKFGIDINLPDITVTKYNTDDKNRTEGWSDETDFENPLGDMGMWTLNIGVGIGPSISVAPLSYTSGYGRYLIAKIYFHYKLSGSALLLDDGGDIDAEYAFCNMFDFGGKISFRRIAVGVEGHWGSGKFKPIVSVEDQETEKTKYKFAATRIYLSYCF
jgi:hypothetical protein